MSSFLVFRAFLNALLAFVMVALVGCTVGPKYKPPIPAAPAAYKEIPPQQSPDGTVWKPAMPQDTLSRGSWWEIYNETELNDLENKLNNSNQNIAQAYQNFMAARALVREARSNYFPTVSTNQSYTRSRTSANLFGGQQSGNLNSNLFESAFGVSWEPDIWGRVRSTVRENANLAQVSAADLANIRLSEQANLAEYYFELRGQDSLIALYKRTVEAYSQSLALTKTLEATGIDNAQDVAQANLNLQTAQSNLTNLQIARAQFEHAIATLIGEPASSFSLPVRELTTPPPEIPAGVPSELLQRRPDIAAAERTMSAANAAIDVQVTAFYPSFSITGTGGFESSNIGDLFNWPSRFFSIGPSAALTLFDAGARRAALANLNALYDADAAAYRQTVLTAFQQVEDDLASQRYLAQQLPQQQAAVDAAQRYLDLAKVRLRTGVDSYLNVFTAQESLLAQQQTYINLRTTQMTSNVLLIEALGGGWNIVQLPTEKEVAAK